MHVPRTSGSIPSKDLVKCEQCDIILSGIMGKGTYLEAAEQITSRNMLCDLKTSKLVLSRLFQSSQGLSLPL